MDKIIKDVIIITSPERAINCKWEPNSATLKNIDVVSHDDIEQLRQVYILPHGYISEGTTLIRHPYNDNEFVDILQAEDIFFKDKINLMSDIFSYVGIRSFTYESTIEKIEQRDIDINGKVTYKAVKVDTNIKRSTEEKYTKKEKKETKYSGDNISPDKAREIAIKANLYRDSDIGLFIENPSSISKSLSMELSNEYNSRLDIALNICAMEGVLKTSIGFTEIVKRRMKINLEIFFTK